MHSKYKNTGFIIRSVHTDVVKKNLFHLKCRMVIWRLLGDLKYAREWVGEFLVRRI